MRVLVTGASGFVGAALVRRLVGAGISVRGTHRRQVPPAIAGVEWCHLGALECAEEIAKLVAGCDVIVHLAALAHQHGSAGKGRSAEFERINVEGTRSLARVSRLAYVRRFVFMSSIAAICSESTSSVDERTECRPQSDYGRSKLAAEVAVHDELASSDTDWCILRPPLAYGPANPGNMARLMRLIETGMPLPFGSIRNRRSFIFVDNLVDALLRVIRWPDRIRSTFVLGDSSDFSTPALVRALARAHGRQSRMVRVPVGLLRMAGQFGDLIERASHLRVGLDTYSVERLIGSLPVDSSRFRETFSWQPPVTPEEGLRSTCAPGRQWV